MSKKLIFNNGKIYLDKIQFFLFPINSFLCLINEILKKETKENIEKILITSSKNDSLINPSEMKNKPFKIIIDELLKKINNFGLGEIELKYIVKNKLTFICKETKISKYYLKIYKKQPSVPIEIIFVGFLKNFIEKYYSKETNYKYKLNNNTITIEISISEKNLKNKKENHFYEIDKNTSISNTIKRIIINKLMTSKKGTLKIWNIPILILPYFYFINLYSSLKEEKYSKFIEILGIMQGRSAVKSQMRIFGLKNNEKLLKSVSEQSELLGGGVIEIKNITPFKYYINNNLKEHFSKFYSEKELKLVETYFINLVRGVYEESYKTKSNLEIRKSLNIITKSNKKENSKIEDEVSHIINMKNIII